MGHRQDKQWLFSLARQMPKPHHDHVIPVSPVPIPEKKRTTRQRFIDFLHNPVFLLPCGFIGGAVGLLVYTPAVAVTVACFVLAFHREEVVKGKSWKVQVPAYFGIVVIGTILSWGAVHVLKEE